MKENSRIRFNPVTKEVEVEGSESFVKTYFNKLMGLMAGSPQETPPDKAGKAAPAEKPKRGKKTIVRPAGAKPKAVRKADQGGKKVIAKKRLTNIETVVTLIREHEDGVTTAELKKKTGLAENQIWNIVNRATKEGRIKKIRRGVYGPREDIVEMEGPVIDE
jgi:hypothetical protein